MIFLTAFLVLAEFACFFPNVSFFIVLYKHFAPNVSQCDSEYGIKALNIKGEIYLFV